MTKLIAIETATRSSQNAALAKQVLEELISQGVREFCLCPGARNAPLVYPLVHSDQVRIYYWPEERSAAFFALGRIKCTGKPAAVITTSGTAAAELLPAAMEAYYTGLPLVLITADRPRRFRGTGAPQSAEQVGLYTSYVHEMMDYAYGDVCSIQKWKREGPIHLNICFEEPDDKDCREIRLEKKDPIQEVTCGNCTPEFSPDGTYLSFLQHTQYPLVVVGALTHSVHEEAIQYLLNMGAPVYLEASSGIREEPRLSLLRIKCIEKVWKKSAENGYAIDGVLRIGGVPTARLWRDLENQEGKIKVCSVSALPFSGLSSAEVIYTDLAGFFAWEKS